MFNFNEIDSFIIFRNICFKCLIIIIILLIQYKLIYKNNSIIVDNKNINNKNINCIFRVFRVDNFSIFFNLTSMNYSFSYKFGKVEFEYYFLFYDNENNFIFPSDLALYYDLHVFCVSKKKNITLQSIGNIYLNKYFNCLEYIDFSMPTKFGLNICYYSSNSSNCTLFDLFDSQYFDYNSLLFLNDDKFDFNYINQQYSSISKKVFNSNNSLYLLKKTYFSEPICSVKEKAIKLKNIWQFKNIYNHYFCFCKGNICPFNQIFDECKYYLYLSIIDNNKDLYEKTYYLLVDFLYSNRAPGDAYFVFREMIKQNMSAFYLSERKDIYQEFYDNETKFQKIIPIINKQYNITGSILEKYLTLFLKLKSVISGSEFFSKENIFLIINYITFICLGHGVNYFKPFLYEEYYGCRRYNKIILPSDKIISIAKKYGWKRKNIIKLGLPKWDLFYNYSLKMRTKLKEKCIFMMFTWRKLREGKKISSYYFKNIFRILNNFMINKLLIAYNVSLYISLHHNLLKDQNLIKGKTKAKYINQEEIVNCLMKCNLVISDFSSVIFDFMYRKKPFIIFIPDSEDINIKDLYDDDYFHIINSLKNDSIPFENKFFNVKDIINKIKYYIRNNFHLDLKLKNLYKSFNLNHKNNINNFIVYLKSLK